MRINTNLTAMNTFTQYTANNSKIASAVAKLSSGYAINTAADNAAGLAISEKMRAQIRGLTKASANAQDAISLVQTAEGSLGEATEILQRMRELAVQAASDTNQDEIDRAALQDEFAQLQQELNDIASTTTFNKKNLLDGSLAATKRTVTNVKLANSGMAVSIGKAAAGKYSFQVVVRKESEAVDAVTAKATAAGGNVAKATFEDIGADNVAKEGALYNGNYTLETEIKDGTLTVKAAGDNGQTFYAKVEKSTIENFEDNWGSLSGAEKILTLKFESGDGANDGFEVNLTFKNAPSTSENGLLALKNAIDDVTVSLDGGVNAQDASYGVYATLTGGEAVKLNAGDTSVTFSNGVTVSFDKLTTTDVAVDTVPITTQVPTAYGNTVNTATATNFNLAAAGVFGADVTNLSMKITAGTLNDSATQLTNITVKSFSVGDTETAITFTDGVNDYSGSITHDTLKGLKGSGETAATTTATLTGAGGSLTLTFSTTQDLTGVTISAGVGSLSGTAATITSTVKNFYNVETPTPSLSQGLLTKLGSSDDVTALEGGAAVGVTESSTFDVTESAGKGLTFQVGANRGDEMVINLDSVNCESLGINSAKVTTQEAAAAAIEAVDNAINKVSSQRAYLGAIQNRLEYKINNLETSTENLTSAESQIRDVDMAKEMTEFTNANILQQAATAMLAQANSLPQNVLSLIRG